MDAEVTIVSVLIFLGVVAVLRAVQLIHFERRTRKEIEKITLSDIPLVCPEHGEVWIWVGNDGHAICSYWIEVLAAEVRNGYGCRMDTEK